MIIKRKIGRQSILVFWIILSILIAGLDSSHAQTKPYTIGVVCHMSIHTPIIAAFKAGLTTLGYIEGKDAVYIHNAIVAPNPQAVDGEIKNLLAQDIDLLLTIGNLSTIDAKQILAGTDVPILFAAVSDPVQEGMVASLRRPGGNITGVQVAGTVIKGLEWLLVIAPKTQTVCIPYNPNDGTSVMFMAKLNAQAPKLGIGLMPLEVHSVEEAEAAIRRLPQDVDAIYRIPSSTLDSKNDVLSRAAIKRGLPMVAGLPLDSSVLLSIGSDHYGIGRQAARLAHQIRQGIKPADLPVETCDTVFFINLKTARAIGLNIPDDILLQANTIIR